MANGVMERGLKQAEAERAEDAAGWAAPAAATATVPDAITPDTVSEWTPAPPHAGVETMTMRGVASATGVLLVLLIAAGAVGWNLVDTEATGQNSVPGLAPPPALRRGRRRLPHDVQAGTGALHRADLCAAGRARAGCDLARLRGSMGRHRLAGRRHHGPRPRCDGVPLRDTDHQGHRAVPPHRDRGDARHRGLLRHLDVALDLRRVRCPSSGTQVRSESCSACSCAGSRHSTSHSTSTSPSAASSRVSPSSSSGSVRSP